ncbi:MAG: GTP pyrophosphokinase family protein [Lachnospiraceae bacterium]|nr:GTP pyrophosphokinase family protein [Lachnospiraceae bacterium]
MDILLWNKILNPYEIAVREIVYKFDRLKTEYRMNGMYCPIEEVSGRVKSISSILDKLHRKEIPIEKMEKKIEDIAGIRIICQFVEDIEQIVEMIQDRDDMKVKTIKDYVKFQKESGYRSFHMIIIYKVETLEGTKKIPVEIQIRTMGMDFWATIEHSLQYKYKRDIPEHVRARLTKAAEAVGALDTEMSAVRSEIMDAQLSSQLLHHQVAEILYAIENLYTVASKREIQKIQDEFYRVYERKDMNALRKFHRQLDMISEGYRTQAMTNDGGKEPQKYDIT